MMGLETIRRMSDVAAYRAAEEGKYPLSIVHGEDAKHIPFLGDYTPAGWRRALWSDFYSTPRSGYPWREDEEATFMVDSSGWGDTGEPALTMPEFQAFLLQPQRPQNEYGWAIREAGQFQVVVGAYIRDEDAPETGLPDEEAVTCEECGFIHDDFEECDEDGYAALHPEDEEEDDEDEVAPGQTTIDDAINALPEGLGNILREVQS